MRPRPTPRALTVVLLLLGTVLLAQPWRRPPLEEVEVVLPPDAEEPAEYSFARLIYGSGGRGDGWGRRGRSWRTDYPKADRQFLQGVRRLTGIHARAMERTLEIMDDDLFD